MNLNTNGLYWLSPLALAVTLAACGGNGGSSFVPDNNNGGNQDSPLLVMHNGGGSVGQIDQLDSGLRVQSTFNADANEGIVLDLLGNVHAADDTAVPSSVQTLHKLLDRQDGASPVATLDRSFTATGSSNLKGVAIAHEAGLIMAANINGNSIEIYGTTAGAGATPLASTALAGDAWDLAYDEAADRVFLAMTNGTILVADDYVANGFSVAGARVITPDSAGMTSNMHGIGYDADSDTLVVTDVGDAAIADDGRLYVIENASTANGTVTPARTVNGPDTLLGNPVDLVLDGSTAYIAEKSNDAILVYRSVFSGPSGDVAPDKTVDSVKPESLAVIMDSPVQPDLSDLEDTSVAINGVMVTRNPDPDNADPDVLVYDTDLTAQSRDFSVGQPVESISVNQTGDAYATYDSGIAVLNRVGVGRDGESFNMSRDRLISGANTGLSAPKGFDIADELGWVLVTENSAPGSVRVFGAQADGDVAPIFSIDLTVQPWDLDYDPEGDRLYVALTDGTVAVYDDLSTDRGAGGADRTIVPGEGGNAFAAPTNLHGIVHVADGDKLILSDVGSGANPTDGKLYVLDNASSADGITNVAVRIDDEDNNAVGNTMLGNPVDIAFDGANLYVAEKSQGMVLRFDNILSSAGGDVSPDESIAQAAPESVVLIADYLGRAPE
jgi:hypothetical protein